MAEITAAELAQLQQGMSDQQKMSFLSQYNAVKKERTTALILSIFLGWLGVDRFYIGDTGTGIAKILTAWICGISWVIDWFTIMGETDHRNRKKAQEIAQAIGQSGDAASPRDLQARLKEPERKCPFCAEIVKREAKICRFCNHELSETPAYNSSEPVAVATPVNYKNCSWCGKQTLAEAAFCTICGKKINKVHPAAEGMSQKLGRFLGGWWVRLPRGEQIALKITGILAILTFIGLLIYSMMNSPTTLENSSQRVPSSTSTTSEGQKSPQIPRPSEPPLLFLTLTGSGNQETQSFLLHEGLVNFQYSVSGNYDTSGENQIPSNFIVDLLDSNGNEINNLVNDIDSSLSGSKGVHIYENGYYVLNVQAKGNWTVAIQEQR